VRHNVSVDAYNQERLISDRLPEDSLFAVGPDERETVACVNFAWDEWEGYATGYHRAGRHLVNYITANDREQDFLVYPIIFCYRHAAEVRMKQIMLAAGRRLERATDFHDSHDLLSLWYEVERFILEVWPKSADHSDLSTVGECLSELAAIDKGSYTFRYPVTSSKAGRSPSLPQHVRQIGLASFAKRMDEILNLLDAVEMGLSAEADQIAEARAHDQDLRDEMNNEWLGEKRDIAREYESDDSDR